MEPTLDWNPSYSVGHPELDAQHQQLLALCRQAGDCLADITVHGNGLFHETLDALVSYTEHHFRREEHILRELAFPDWNAHRAEHAHYQIRLSEFLLEASCGRLDKAGLVEFLTSWWTNHILHDDMRYKSLVSSAA